jgi:signal transduction histidine kinase
MIGLATIAMATLSGFLSLYILYSGAILGISFLKLVSLNDQAYATLALLTPVVFGLLLFIAYRMNKLFVDLLRLSIKNEQLAMIEAASKQSIVDFSKKLSAKTNELERVTAQLKSMVTVLSHDLRTHLTTLLQCSRLINRSEEKLLDRAHIAGTLQRSAESGIQLVDDLIGITGIAPSTLNLDMTNGSIHDIVARAIERVQGAARDKGVQIFLAVDEDRPVKVDIQRIEDVLTGLIEAAIEQTRPDGSVTVQSTPTIRGLRMEVIDTGESNTTLFVGAEQGSSTISHLQEIVKAHESHIEVKSNPRSGSCISFVLPWGEQKEKDKG